MSETSGLRRLAGFLLVSWPVTLVVLGLTLTAGFIASPFEWELAGLTRSPLPVDALPDIGENQQVVFTEWPGASPRDVEDQVTYPLTSSLLGLAGVKTVRATSMLGLSNVYVIFEDGVDFYWARSRVLEKLAALPQGTLPTGVSPSLGPDATALGQVFWYTLEGRDSAGSTVGGWDLHELRAVQDFTLRYALEGVSGVAEVSSVGGYVKEYQVDLDPDAMRAHQVTLDDVSSAVRASNRDVGARTLEINRVEYLVRGLGRVESLADLEQIVVAEREHTPILLKDVARVNIGPAQRRGALDDGGAEAVGGVVVTRYGQNPLRVIEDVKRKLAELAPGLPERELADGSRSRITVVPFYDRSVLIRQTLGTLSHALALQLLVTLLVVVLLLRRMRGALLISGLLPVCVLGTFAIMRITGVDANVMALSGIAIAIGSMVDIAIVFVEHAGRELELRPEGEPRQRTLARAAAEVAAPVFTSVVTTVISFLPVFALTGAEGKLFAPLAFTKTYAMVLALALGFVLLPAGCALALGRGRSREGRVERGAHGVLLLAALALASLWLTRLWSPLGPERSQGENVLFVLLILAALLLPLLLLRRVYPAVLRLLLAHKGAFVVVPALGVLLGLMIWLGAAPLASRLPRTLRDSELAQRLARSFPGLGREYMPAFDEGAFLYMPTTMAHASIGQSLEMLHQLDAALAQIPEVERVVGKLGRADSALDPAPISMFESVITYRPKYTTTASGERQRNWRPHIQTPDDIWKEVVKVGAMPGLTGAPKLQPISTRIVMLQSGTRAPIALQLKGADLPTLERFGLDVARLLERIAEVETASVVADRVVGKPHLEIDIDRQAIARHGLTVDRVQQVIRTALGGSRLSQTIEGRQRYSIRVRYQRELRDSIDSLTRVNVPIRPDHHVPLGELVQVRYVKGPQAIRTEDTFLTSHVLFGAAAGVSEVEAVQAARLEIEAALDTSVLRMPAGVSYRFTGNYENTLRSERQLRLLVPLALSLVWLVLYLQFRRFSSVLVIYAGVVVAMAGGFMLLWLYAQPWFLDAELFGANLREVFRVGPVNMSVAVWVGFLVLLGISTDDGVIMTSYLQRRLDRQPPADREQLRALVVEAAMRRVRPCLMTTGTTVLALLPVVTAQGKGADLMLPMALPVVGGMLLQLMALFLTPVLYCAVREWGLADGAAPLPLTTADMVEGES